MLGSAPLAVSVRSYGSAGGIHCHDFAQLVLPLQGSLLIAIAGQEATLGRDLAAFVHQGTQHEQASKPSDRFLIVDLDPKGLSPHQLDRLASQALLRLAPEANTLIDYMGLSLAKGTVPLSRLRQWMPLLLDALTGDDAGPASRLAALLAALDATPFRPWTAATMAAKAGLSVSRLHALFRDELDTTPHAWLARLRLNQVQDWLVRTDLSLAELAYRGGYADQSALTRAMRKATGLTPAAYRRQHRIPGLRSARFGQD